MVPTLCSKPSGCGGQAEGSPSWFPAWINYPGPGAGGGGELAGPTVLTFSPVDQNHRAALGLASWLVSEFHLGHEF